MAISENKTVRIEGEDQKFQKGEVLMSRREQFFEWIKNTGIGKTIVGENYEKLKYWSGLEGAILGGMGGFSLATLLDQDPTAMTGLGAVTGAAIRGSITHFLDGRHQIGHRLVPTKATT